MRNAKTVKFEPKRPSLLRKVRGIAPAAFAALLCSLVTSRPSAAGAGQSNSASFNPEPPAHHAAHGSQRYTKPTVQDVLWNRTKALEYAEKTRQTIAPTMHVVETEHFLICSAWNGSHDAALGGVAERMYQRLSEQFNVPATESVWNGKCPIYLFWDPSHYARFIAEVDDSQKMNSSAAHASGYHATRGAFSYIVINGVSEFGTTLPQATAEFYHVLVHEGTHAFLNRYVTDRALPLWVEEGLADFIAGCLVPESQVNRQYIEATQTALRKPELIKKLFNKEKSLTPIEYGLAQSFVRFLVGRDRAAMVRFLDLMKGGDSEESALEQAYGATRSDLARIWAAQWERVSQSPRRR